MADRPDTTIPASAYKLKILVLAMAFAMAFTLGHLWMTILQAAVSLPLLLICVVKFWKAP